MNRFLVAVILPLILIASARAEAVRLELTSGENYEGVIQYVRNEWVYLQTQNGAVKRFLIATLNSAGKKRVATWIEVKGGTKEYASWIGTINASFSKPWPRVVYGPKSIQLRKHQQLSGGGVYVYESSHYRFIIDTKVEPRVIQRFAVLFETTYKYVLSLPINASGRDLERDAKLPIYLFGDAASYYKAGGPMGSAGVYMPKNHSVLVPLSELGVQRRGNKWEYLKGGENRVLSHELTHQLSAGPRFGSWYLEGAAEYVAATRYTHGAYHASHGKHRVFAYVKDEKGLSDGSGRRLGSRVKMMKLEEFMNLPYHRFAAEEANKNYGVGLLLTYFFYHVDGRGEGARIKQYIKALQQGRSESEARRYLLAGRKYSQLENEFKKFCATGGVNLEFR